MTNIYQEKENSDIQILFPDGLVWRRFDLPGARQPVNMKLCDVVIERPQDILLVELKDPSHHRAETKNQNKFLKTIHDRSLIREDLVPKARDTYLYEHLMERDTKPFIYVIVIALDAFPASLGFGQMSSFKDTVLDVLRHETDTGWRRTHIADCVVLDMHAWNARFPQWPMRRISTAERH